MIHVDIVSQLMCEYSTDQSKWQELQRVVSSAQDHFDVLTGIPISTGEFVVGFEFHEVVHLQSMRFHNRFEDRTQLLETKESIGVVWVALHRRDKVDVWVSGCIPVVQANVL